MIDFSYCLAGAITGFVVGLTGVGGGALMTPILLIFFAVPPTTAIATDLWFAAVTKIVSAKVHHTNGNVDWQIAKRLWSGSLPMALLTVVAISSGAQISKLNWLTNAIGAVLVVTAAGLVASPKLMSLAREQRFLNAKKFKAAQPALTVFAGAALGVCVTLTSIGAGALGSVMLLYLYPLRMTPHRLVATDIVHAIPLAVTAGLGYLLVGMVDWYMLISLLSGSIPSVIAGSHLSAKAPVRLIQISLALILMLAGLKTFL